MCVRQIGAVHLYTYRTRGVCLRLHRVQAAVGRDRFDRSLVRSLVRYPSSPVQSRVRTVRGAVANATRNEHAIKRAGYLGRTAIPAGIVQPQKVMVLDSVVLRERRQQLGLTQAGLASALGVAANTVARWERGEQTHWSSRTRLACAGALIRRRGSTVDGHSLTPP